MTKSDWEVALDLMKKVKGDVHSEPYIREVYSTDASIYKLTPQLVVMPKDKDDVIEVVKYAKENNIPITARSAGTNPSGSCLGTGIVIDFTKHMNNFIDLEKKDSKYYATVQPGITAKALNKILAKHNLFLPSVSSRESSTIGGNVATKASGPRSIKYGSIDRYVKSITFVDAKGRLVDTSSLKSIEEAKLNQIKYVAEKLKRDQRTLSLLKRKEELKTNSSYNLFALYRYEDFRDIITHLLVGSIGTLGIFTKIVLEVIPKPAQTSTTLVYFKEINTAAESVEQIVKLKPSSVELMDDVALTLVKQQHPELNIPENASASLLIEFDENIQDKVRQLEALLKGRKVLEIKHETFNPENLWKVRKTILPILSTYSKMKKPTPIFDDVSVRVKDVSLLIQDLKRIFKRHNITCVIYGHISEGNLHLVPILNLNEAANRELLKPLADDIYAAVLKYNGSIAAEHALGRSRSSYMVKEWGILIHDYMAKIKDTFDGEDLFNPRTIFDSQHIDENLKYPRDIIDELEYRCNDCGTCRSVCPVSKVDKGETGSREKMNLIRYIHSKEDYANLTKIKERIVDCLGCRLCTLSCPSSANTYKMVVKEKEEWFNPRDFKSNKLKELTYNYENTERKIRLAARMQFLSKNTVSRSVISLVTGVADKYGKGFKIDSKRILPRLAKHDAKHRTIFARTELIEPKMTVAYFSGCFDNFFDTQVPEAIANVLSKNNIKVIVPEQRCCGAPMEESGYNEAYITNARFNIDSLLRSGVDAVITSCSSCSLALKEYYKNMDEEEYREKARKLRSKVFDISEFLLNNTWLKHKKINKRVAYHPPCHMKVQKIDKIGKNIVKNLSELFVEIDDGCCGGAKTYSLENYDKANKIFNLKVESIKEVKPDIIVTSCPSCVVQIKEGLRRNLIDAEVLNLVEFVNKVMS